MRQMIELTEETGNREALSKKYLLERSLDLQFEPSDSGNVHVSAVPRSLNTAMRLQYLLHSSAGGRVRACKSCGILMEIGGGKGRRSHAEFCSDRCRVSYHRSRIRK